VCPDTHFGSRHALRTAWFEPKCAVREVHPHGRHAAGIHKARRAAAYRRDVNDLAGPVALALVGLWVAYLVPHKLRHRQQLLESRADDRYSEALRVVAVSDRPGRAHRSERKIARPASASAECTPRIAARSLLTPGKGVPALPAGTATGGTTVDRPLGTQERLAADAARRRAQAHAARAAAVARRQAAARRRAVLAVGLVALTVVGWGAAAATAALTWVVGAVPTVLLGSVLVLGRRASRSWAAADAEWEARLAAERREAARLRPRTGATPVVQPAPQPLVTGRAVHPSDTSTQVFKAVVADRGEEAATAPHSTGATPVVRKSVISRPTPVVAEPTEAGRADKRDDRPQRQAAERSQAEAEPPQTTWSDDEWSPVPVPRPTYTMKASAPRREPAPLGEVEGSTAAAPAPAAAPAAPAEAEQPRPALEPPATTTGTIDLDAVLAKRRAAGE
jgi:hypothetical protein